MIWGRRCLHTTLFLALFAPCAALFAQTPALPLPPQSPAPALPKRLAAPLLPIEGLQGELLGELLLADIAAARGQVQLAASIYLIAAQREAHPMLAERATELALSANQMSLTTSAVRRWIALEPNSKNPLQMVALAFSGQTEKLADVEAPLQRLLSIQTEGSIGPLLERLPHLVIANPDKAGARRLVERLTQDWLKYPQSYVARGLVALEADDPAAADRAAQQALSLNPALESAARLRVQAAAPNRKNAAMETLQSFTQRNPSAKLAREDLARWLTQQRSSQALPAWQALLKDFPQDENLTLRALSQWLKLDNSEKPDALIRRLLNTLQGNRNALQLLLGNTQEARGQYKEALETYRQVEVSEVFMTARLRMAQIQFAQGGTDEARNLLIDAIRRNPEKGYVVELWQVSVLSQSGQREAALKRLEDYLSSQAENADVLHDAAILADQLQRFEDAERWLRRAMALTPEDPRLYNALGYTFANRNLRLNEAERLLNRASGLDPNSPAIIDSLGWLRFRQGKFDAAIELLRRAYQLDAEGEIAAHLGEALWASGKQEEARKVWHEALLKQPQDAALNETLNRLTKNAK